MEIYKSAYCIVDDLENFAEIGPYEEDHNDRLMFYHLYHEASNANDFDFARVYKHEFRFYSDDYTSTEMAVIYITKIGNNGETHFWSLDKRALHSFTCGKMEIEKVEF